MAPSASPQPSDPTSTVGTYHSGAKPPTPMHREKYAKEDDQGFLIRPDCYWPVLVLRDALIPEKARIERGNEETLPV
jgi:hypothetical protein